jgi:two-component system sensor histidine kinase/response regulator
MLEFDGCEVAVVDDGKGAVAAFSPGDFDLIMMDCYMPILDGFEASEQIRSKERAVNATSRIPIIALTADVQKGIRDRCLAAGMDDYLSKPFTTQQLGQKLTMWLGDWTKFPGQADRLETENVKEPEPETPTGAKFPQAPQEDGHDLLDQDTLNRISQLQRPGGPDILQAVIRKFLEGYENSTTAVLTAIENNDPKALFSAAHFLKSGYANLGATTMAHICKILEEISRADSPMNSSALVEEFIEESDKVKRALNQLLEQEVNV